MGAGVTDLAEIANLVHGDALDADGQPVMPNGRLWDVEAPAKGGIGWNGAVQKHGALPMQAGHPHMLISTASQGHLGTARKACDTRGLLARVLDRRFVC